MSEELLNQFWGRLARAKHRALLLDYDGTLAPFTPDRDNAMPYPGVVDAIDEIMAVGRTRVIVVTGRSARDIPRLLPLKRLPEVWGSHGLERMYPDSSLQPLALVPDVAAALDKAKLLALDAGLTAQLEEKPGCVAVHWRGVPAGQEQQARALEPRWRELAASERIALRHFDGGIELRSVMRTKADAVNAVLAEEPHGLALAYLGDDLTDEDAFKALGGGGLGVLVRPEHRETAAQVWLTPPEQLLDFLHRWHAADAATPANLLEEEHGV